MLAPVLAPDAVVAVEVCSFEYLAAVVVLCSSSWRHIGSHEIH